MRVIGRAYVEHFCLGIGGSSFKHLRLGESIRKKETRRGARVGRSQTFRSLLGFVCLVGLVLFYCCFVFFFFIFVVVLFFLFFGLVPVSLGPISVGFGFVCAQRPTL